MACSDDDSPPPEAADYSSIIENIGTNVIVATYVDLQNKGGELQTATATLEATPNAANLDAARAAWVAARSPWEQSEGFLFGPVDEEGLDPSMDSWPVNVTDLNNVLNGSDVLTASFLAAQEGTLKGFHTIEFLLWGESGAKTVEQFTDREFEYLAAASEVLANDTKALANLWVTNDGNYVNFLLTAGENNVFPSQKSALEQIVDAMVVIADEVANGKINDPLSEMDLSLEESRFSANSKADFSDNMRSIQNVYLGKFGGSGNGNGISTLIAESDPALDSRVNAEIEAAIQSILDIPGTFSDAVFQNSDAVETAQQAVRTLQATLEGDVLPTIRDL
jgi:uncharacterized iron-regulated protein